MSSWGTLLGEVTVTCSVVLEETALACSWKSAPMFRTGSLPCLYPNLEGSASSRASRVTGCVCSQARGVTYSETSIGCFAKHISAICCLFMSEEHFYILTAAGLYKSF